MILLKSEFFVKKDFFSIFHYLSSNDGWFLEELERQNSLSLNNYWDPIPKEIRDI